MYNYYKEQLENLEFNQNTNISIKFVTQYPHSETKYMLINSDKINIFIEFLQKLKKMKNNWRPNGFICMDCGEHIYHCICEDKPKR